ncbi:MAG: YcxB family protein [Enterocloster asparagiformis]|nr:YcxB family protein [Enterocloster asparagiformis]
MRMVFNFKMSLEDYHQMMVSRTFGNSWTRRIILLVVWLVFTGLIILDLTGVVQLTRVVHVCALLVAVSFPAAVITMEINVSKYKDAYLSGFKAERQIVADDEGLTFCNRSTGESGSNTWAEVTKLEELKNVFVIQLNRREAVILPKRGMGNTKKVDQFREMVKEKLPERFYPLKRSVFR